MARALARAVALALAVPMPALAQAVTEGWQISGTNVIRAERYDASGDRTFVPYPFLGNTGYDEFNIAGLSRPSPYSMRRFLIAGVVNDSPYRSQDRGIVPERLNFMAESGEWAWAWRAEAGDFFAFTTMRTQQRSLKGASVELQPALDPSIRQSIVLFGGAAQPSWRDAQWSDDNTLGISWLVDTDRFGRWNANVLRNERGANERFSRSEDQSQTVASLAAETLLDLAAWKLRVEGEVARMKGDYDSFDPAVDGRDRSDSGYFAQVSAFDPVYNVRLRAERYGRDYRPFGAVTPADRRSLEAFAGANLPQGLSLRLRLQDFSDQHESANPLDTRVAGANLSGSYAPWALSGMLDAFVQDSERDDRSIDSRFSQVALNLSRPMGGGWIAQLNAMRLDLDDHANDTFSSTTSQVQVAAILPVTWGVVSGSVTPGVMYRRITGFGATRDWQPTLSMALFGGPHRFTLNLGGLKQDPRLETAPDVATVNAAFDYRYRWGRHEFGVDATLFERRPSPGMDSSAWRLGASWTWFFENAPAATVRSSPGYSLAQAAPVPDRVALNASLLAKLTPGQPLAAVEQSLAASGIGAGVAEPRAQVYEARILEDVEQRQRLVVTHDAGIVDRVALLVSLDGVADASRVYERVRRALLDVFGAPTTTFDEGAWSTAYARDVAAGKLIRITEWATPTGVLKLGIPRRLDGVARIEVHHARTSASPRDTNWGLEAVR